MCYFEFEYAILLSCYFAIMKIAENKLITQESRLFILNLYSEFFNLEMSLLKICFKV